MNLSSLSRQVAMSIRPFCQSDWRTYLLGLLLLHFDPNQLHEKVAAVVSNTLQSVHSQSVDHRLSASARLMVTVSTCTMSLADPEW